MPPTPAEPSRRTFLAASGTALIASSAMPSQDPPPLAPPDKQPPHVKVPEPPEKTVGFAIVGLGQLALEEVMPAFAKAKLARPVALVSGHPDKARKVAATYGLDPKAIYDYRNYEGMAENPAIQAVFVILPNSMHAEYTVRAFKAGKHVLCEKPMAVTPGECEQMIAAGKAAKRKLMVAYRLRYEPFNMAAIELCRKKEFGALRLIAASNGQNTKAPNIRLSADLGGGPLQDVGIYCLNAARYLAGEEPVEVSGFAHQPKDDPRFREVPESVAFTLRFPSGVIAHCDCSFGVGESRDCRVMGTDGELHLEKAFGYMGQKLKVRKASGTTEPKLEEVNHFAAEMDHFAECILKDQAPRTPGEEGLADMRAIAAIQESYKNGGKVVAVKG